MPDDLAIQGRDQRDWRQSGRRRPERLDQAGNPVRTIKSLRVYVADSPVIARRLRSDLIVGRHRQEVRDRPVVPRRLSRRWFAPRRCHADDRAASVRTAWLDTHLSRCIVGYRARPEFNEWGDGSVRGLSPCPAPDNGSSIPNYCINLNVGRGVSTTGTTRPSRSAPLTQPLLPAPRAGYPRRGSSVRAIRATHGAGGPWRSCLVASFRQGLASAGLLRRDGARP